MRGVGGLQSFAKSPVKVEKKVKLQVTKDLMAGSMMGDM